MKKTNLMLAAALAAVTGLAAVTHREMVSPTQNLVSSKAPAALASKVRKAPAEIKPFERAESPQRLTAPAKAAANLPTLYGAVIYNDDWYDAASGSLNAQYGYYALTPGSSISLSPIALHQNLYINGGGAYSDHKIHYHLWEMYADDESEIGIVYHNYYCVVNTDNWSFENIVDYSANETNVANDMTYDSANDRLYSLEWGTYDGGYNDLACIDKTTGESNIIISKMPDMICIAADNFGRLFTVGYDGSTYYINPDTKEIIKLGDSGVQPAFMQSATVDPETNTIYWAATHKDETAALYTINTSTGHADLIAPMPGNAELTALFIEADVKGLNAPAEVDNLSINYADGNSVITCNAPTKGFDGSALSGSVDVTLYIDGNLKGTRSVNPGEQVYFTNRISDGSHPVVIYASNSVGDGAKTIRSQFAGNDVPAAPKNLTLSVEGSVATLNWDAPAEGANGGSIDPATLTYEVVRYPGAVTVAEAQTATSFTETLPQGTATYYYVVTPSTSVGKGASATSNSFYLGTALTLPYYQPFDSQESTDGFTLISSEGRGWYWWHNTVLNFKAMACKFNMEKQCDEWMMLPAFNLNPTSEYCLTFDAWAFDADSPERFEVTIGMGTTPEAQNKTLVATHTITNTTANTYKVPFTVNTDGSYNIAFHSTPTAKSSYYLLIDNIRIEETATNDGPAAVTNLKATAGKAGALTATLTFNAPTKTYGGADLTSITSIDIFRGTETEPCGKVENPAPGAACTWIDNNAAQGDNTYRVKAMNPAGAGVESTVTVYVGYDVPMPATNVKAVENDGKAVITWDAPTKGLQGGNLVASEIRYKIYDNTGELLSEGLTSPRYVDSRFTSAVSQKFIYYQVHVQYGTLESEGTLCDFIVLGPDNELPFAESFSESGLDNVPWTLSNIAGNVNGAWGMADMSTGNAAKPQDDDSGMAIFYSSNFPSGVCARLTSPKLNLAYLSHPVVDFWVYLTGSSREKLDLEICHNDNSYTTIKSIDLAAGEGWTNFKIEIPREQCRTASMIAFKATSGGYGPNICVDNINVYDDPSLAKTIDLAADAIELPSELMVGDTGEFNVDVTNVGQETVNTYKVSLICDGMAVMTTDSTQPIEPGQTMRFVFKATADQSDYMVTYKYRGKVSCDGDADPSNDLTEEKYLTIGLSGIEDVIADGANGPVDIYTTLGVCLKRGATKADIDNLAPGIYIIGGKKIQIK